MTRHETYNNLRLCVTSFYSTSDERVLVIRRAEFRRDTDNDDWMLSPSCLLSSRGRGEVGRVLACCQLFFSFAQSIEVGGWHAILAPALRRGALPERCLVNHSILVAGLTGKEALMLTGEAV